MHLLIVAGVSFGLVSSALAAERAATKAEIENIAVGHLVSGKMRYGTDGKYTYGGKFPGRYKISNGKVCINFNDGGKRCDRIVTSDGKKFTLVNSQGKRFPYSN